MITLGVILLVLGMLLGIPLLNTVGGILLVVGLILLVLGAIGSPVGSRNHYF